MNAPTPLLVACLCAAWCRLCEDYRATFAAAAAAHPSHRFVFVDIEDEAERLQALDVENFPTLLIAAGGELRFLGVLTPQPQTLERLLRAAQADELPRPEHGLSAVELSELLHGLRELGPVV